MYRIAIFLTGAVILALQIIASRIMTPYFGVNLYIWTSILSTTLLFLAFGYFFGGIVTRRVPEHRISYLYCAAPAISAISLLAAGLLYPITFPDIARWNLVFGSFIACLIILAIPLTALSALNPLLVAIERTRRIHRAGGDIESAHDDAGSGVVFFISTLGSVVGVLFAAFLLIPNLRNSTSLTISAIGLSAVSLILVMVTPDLLRRARIQLTLLAIAGVCLGLVALFGSIDQTLGQLMNNQRDNVLWKTVASEPSLLGNLKVVDLYNGESTKPVRRLLLNDGMIQNGVSNDGVPVYLFTHALEHLAVAAVPKAEKALVLGIGAGIVPSRLSAAGIQVDAVEINPKMVELAKQFFEFDSGSANVAIEDGRTFVHRCETKYDIVVIDLYSGDGVPEHLVTKEFLSDVRACLRPNGVVVMNLVYYPLDPVPLRSLAATLVHVFGEAGLLVQPSRAPNVATNGYFLAIRGSIPAGMALDTDSVPQLLRATWRLTLKSAVIINKDSDLVTGTSPISDENNRWSTLTVATNARVRTRILSTVPTALLAN